MSEISKRGWRTEGWREEILPMPEIEASFLHPHSYAPLGEGGTHFWRTFWLVWSPEVPQTSPQDSRTSPKFSPSLGSPTPSPDSQILSLDRCPPHCNP